MDNLRKNFKDILEFKNIENAYKSYIDSNGKIPVEELYIDDNLKEKLKKVIEDDRGFIIMNTDENENSEVLDVGDIYQLVEELNALGFATNFIFSYNLKDLIIKVRKVAPDNTDEGMKW
jgi:hypothetical protein